MGNGITLKLQNDTLYGREKTEKTTLGSNFANTELHTLKTLSKKRTLQKTNNKKTLLKKSSIKIVKGSGINVKPTKRKKMSYRYVKVA